MPLFNEALIARLRERRHDPAFADAWTAITDRAERALTELLAIPTEGGGWGHDYFCPDHAALLEYDTAQPFAHRCPIDGRIFSGEPFDGAWRSYTQSRIVDGLHALALIWLADGEQRHAERAGALLLQYAANYPHYPVHGEHAGQGRCLGQSLDEAVWSIPLAQAYDAIRDTLAPADRALIERDLLRPLGEHLHGQLWRRIHNIECWHLAGLATVGAVLNEPSYLAPALDEAHGLAAQIAGGVLDDGWWWEGSPTYHFYTLRAVMALATALAEHHPAALDNPRLRAMLSAPLTLVRDDLSLAATNDGWLREAEPGAMLAHAPIYEAAWGLWGNPAHAAFLARLYAVGAPRSSFEALLFGPTTLPVAAKDSLASTVHDANGYAVLRGGDPERWLLLKYGPHGGGHGHPDKLALDLHGVGRRLAADLGTPGYGIPLNKTWYRHTLSHNTVLVDETIQPPATGRLVRFTAPEDGAFGVAEAAVTWPADAPTPYAGVAMSRCILWKGAAPYFIDIVRVAIPTGAPHQIDLAWHHAGALDNPALIPATLHSEDSTYALLDVEGQFQGREWQATWREGEVGTACWARDPDGATAFATRAPSNPAAEKVSLLLRRVTASAATFVAIFEPFVGQPTIRRVTWNEPEPAGGNVLGITVEGDVWHDAWQIEEGEDGETETEMSNEETNVYHYQLGALIAE
jgi:hypothetical protein